jgi:hypothetical protein
MSTTGICTACTTVGCSQCDQSGVTETCKACLAGTSTTQGYYLNALVCSTCDTPDDKCAAYSTTSVVTVTGTQPAVPKCQCTKCKNELANPRYLKDGICVAHNTDSHCAAYSDTENRCVSCSTGYYLDPAKPAVTSNIDNQCLKYNQQNC